MRRMKLFTVFCFSAMVLAAQSNAQSNAAQSNAAPAASTPTGIPAGAVKAEDGYHYTDAQGRKWIYRRTPFGISHALATDSAPAAAGATSAAGGQTAAGDSTSAASGHTATSSTPAAGGHIAATSTAPATKTAGTSSRPATAAEANIRATDHGDTVSFERPGPFGVYKWERKKSEMDPAERAAWQRAAAPVDDRK
jgi:hypothetical protein